jgi:hypothetical protein
MASDQIQLVHLDTTVAEALNQLVKLLLFRNFANNILKFYPFLS